jgi:acid phosphatase type 7
MPRASRSCTRYLQNVTTTGITIMWESTEPTPDAIEYGLTTAYDSQQVATMQAMQAMRDGMWLHKAVLTDLTGATTYHYRLVTPDNNAPDHTFKTAPSPTADFSFAVWADSQGTTDENISDPLEPTKALMHHLADVEQVDMAVAVGDMAETGDNTPSVRRYFLNRAADIVGSKLPFYIAWGNHDGPEGSIIRSYVDLPGQRSYSFDYGGVHFICADYFDTQKDITDFVMADLQSPAAAQARFIFFFIHTAPYYERWYEGEKWLRSKIVPLLEKHQVAISFSGHMHGYERGLLNGVHYVTTGGGSWLDSFEPLVRDWPHITVGGFSDPPPSPINNGIVNEYVKVEISGNVATVRTFGFAPEGQFLGQIDLFTVTSP